MADFSGKFASINEDVGFDDEKGFAVEPKTDCPHVHQLSLPPSEFHHALFNLPCGGCDSSGENWLCVHCASVGCSRYVQGHAKRHYEDQQHHIAYSLSDASMWCFTCDSYIDHELLRKYFITFAEHKFGADSDAFSATVAWAHSSPVVENTKSSIVNAMSVPCPEEFLKPVQAPSTQAASAAAPIVHTASASSSDPVLATPSVEALCAALKQGAFKRVVVMAGAGISVSAGIPDFRTPGTGLYSQLERFNLERPEDIFTLDFFRENPQPFSLLAKELFPGQFAPTLTHHFIKWLADRGWLQRCFTQNIDGLEGIAGIDPELVVQAHGGFDRAHCIDCRTEYAVSSVREQLMTDQIPRCSAVLGSVASSDTPCNGLVKPDIVFFGESLPKRFFECVANDFSRADLLIVMGTSLKVQPFASLISRVGSNVPRLLINREAVGVRPKIPHDLLERMLMLGLIDPDDIASGFAFDEPDNDRDVFLQGDCDSGVRTMAQLMGVESDLDALHSSFKL